MQSEISNPPRFEYDNGVMVCKEHRTPAQKDARGFWCRKCDAALQADVNSFLAPPQ